MKNILKKLGSRKLWIAIAGVGTGIALAMGVDANDIKTVSGAVVSVGSVIAYIITEGRIDAQNAKIAIENTQNAVDVLKGSDENDSE